MTLHKIFVSSFISYLVAAAGLQTLWSFSLAITDVYALLVRRSLQNYRIVSLFTIGDGVRFTVRLYNLLQFCNVKIRVAFGLVFRIPFTLLTAICNTIFKN